MGLRSWFKSAVSPGGDLYPTLGYSGQGQYQWPFAYTPSSRIDYAKEAGDSLQNGIIVATVGWITRVDPEAPIRVYTQPSGDTKPEIVPHHPLTALIDKPNEWYSGLHLRQALLWSYNLDGNAYILKFYNDGGGVGELWYEPHFTIRPVAARGQFIDHYQVLRGGSWKDLPRANVIHIRNGLDPRNPRLGLSPLKAVLREVFTDNEASNYTASLLRNAGIPGMLVSPPSGSDAVIDEPDKLKDTIIAKFGGDRRGEPLVMSSPLSVEQFGFSPEQMDLSKLRNIPEERITAVLGIPAMVVGMGSGLDRSTFSNYEQGKAAAYESNLIPTHRIFAQQLTNDLLPDLGNPDTEHVAYDHSEIQALSEDENGRAARWTQLYQGGIAQRYEARTEMGLDAGDEDRLYISDVAHVTDSIREQEGPGTIIDPVTGKPRIVPNRTPTLPPPVPVLPAPPTNGKTP